MDTFLRKSSSTLGGIRAADENGIVDGLELTLRCSVEHNCLDVDLTFGSRGAHLFPRFCAKRLEIDSQLGQTALWFKQGSERHIRVQHWADVRQEALWPAFHEWMRAKGELLLARARSIVRGY